MNSKSSNIPSSSDVYVGEVLVHRGNESKPNNANTIGAIKYTDCQDGAYNMPLQENLPSKEYNRDGILGIERVPFSKMPVLCPGIAKSGNSSSTRPSQHKNGYTRSRLGPQERLGDIKASFQPSNSSKREGRVVDDREELMTATASAHSARQQACPSPFWERMDTILAPITAEDVLRLNQQRHDELLDRVQSHVSSGERGKSGHAYLLNMTSRVSSDERLKNLLMKASHGAEQSSLEHGLLSSATSLSRSGIAKTDTIPSLYQRVLSANIDKKDLEHLYGREGIRPEHNSDVNLQFDDICMDRVYDDKIFQSDGHMIIPSSFSSVEQCEADDGSRLIHDSWNCNGLDFIMPSKVQMPPPSSFHWDYMSLSPDGKLRPELQSIVMFLCPEMQASIVNDKFMKDVEHEQGLQKRATEEVALDKIAYHKMPLGGRITQPSTRNWSKTSTKMDLAFVESDHQRYTEFDKTWTSCFCDPNLQDAMYPAPPCNTNKENIELNSLIAGNTSLSVVGKRKRGIPSVSTAAGGTVKNNKRKSLCVETVVRPPSTETEGGYISQSGGVNMHLPNSNQVVSQSRKGKEKVDDGMLIGASEIISEVVERKRVPPRRYTYPSMTRIPTLPNSSSSVVAPIKTDCDVLLQTPTGELDALNEVGKPEDLKIFLDFLDVDAALAKGR